MSDSTAAIDLTDDHDEAAVDLTSSSSARKRKSHYHEIEYVWLAMHQLEAAYGGIGDFSVERGMGITAPDTFDATILGVYTTKAAANRAARDYCIELGWCDGDEEDEEGDGDGGVVCDDFEGEGEFRDGADSGDVNTFSERVFVQSKYLHR